MQKLVQHLWCAQCDMDTPPVQRWHGGCHCIWDGMGCVRITTYLTCTAWCTSIIKCNNTTINNNIDQLDHHASGASHPPSTQPVWDTFPPWQEHVAGCVCTSSTSRKPSMVHPGSWRHQWSFWNITSLSTVHQYSYVHPYIDTLRMRSRQRNAWCWKLESVQWQHSLRVT